MNLERPPDVAPLDEARVRARLAHLERELSLGGRRRPSRRALARVATVTVALAIAGAIVLSGRDGSPNALARARAAGSEGPYLGVVVATGSHGRVPLVHL